MLDPQAAVRLLHGLQTRGDEVALIDERAWSFAELHARATAHAEALTVLGLQPGDRVCVYARTSVAVVVSLLGHHLGGFIHVPINPGYREAEVGHILMDAQGRALIIDDDSERLDVLRALPKGLVRACGVTDVLVVGAANSALPLPHHWLEEWHARPVMTSSTARALPGDHDTAVLIYTSGTTGKSKGVELTFGNIVAAIGALSALWEMSRDDVVVHALPLFHVHGLCAAWHGALLSGARVRVLEKFTPAAVVRAIDDGGTVFMGVPTMYTRLLAHLDAHPDDGKILARARLFCAGSAALSPRDLLAFELHTGHRILERYGMSETLMTLSNPLRGERRAGSVGRVVPGYTTALVDDDDTPCAVGVPGELLVRGPGVMKGYWRAPAATAAAFRMHNGVHWFATGDVVTVDEGGYHNIVGRKSTDILKVGGYKIASREIEEAIASHPWVHEVAVVGVPDDEWGQRVVACVVLRDSALEQAHDDILQALQEHVRLHESKKPRALHVVTALPRNALGKVQKHELVRQLAG